MQCNIDAKGRAARLAIGGVLALAGAILLLVWLLRAHEAPWKFWTAVGLLAAGLVSMIEGWSGWCVIRAMGFKTRT